MLKVLRRARNRFLQQKQSFSDRNPSLNHRSIDNHSDSGVFTASSRTNFNDDFESNSLLDIDEDYFETINADDPDSELLCQSLEAVLMETLLELRQLRSSNRQTYSSKKNDQQELITRL